jgi:DNA polymerase II small subunit/DNA polymerase delta subunit B
MTLEELIKARNPSLDAGEITDFLNIIRARIEHVRQVISENEGDAAVMGEKWEAFRKAYERDRMQELGL